MRTGNYYSATSNNMKLVQWPLVGGLLHLVQRGGEWLAGCGLGISWRCLMLIKLEWLGYRIMMLSSFHLIPERHGVWTDRQTDGRTDGRTDRQICCINIARQCADCWRAIKNRRSFPFRWSWKILDSTLAHISRVLLHDRHVWLIQTVASDLGRPWRSFRLYTSFVGK